MDPNTALQKLRISIMNYHNAVEAGNEGAVLEYSADVVEAAEALDQWMTKAGFLPDGWLRGR